MEQNIRLVVLEHLRNQLNVHILDVDFLDLLVSIDDARSEHKDTHLQAFVEYHNCFIEFFLVQQ